MNFFWKASIEQEHLNGKVKPDFKNFISFKNVNFFQGKKHLFKNYNIAIHKNKLNVIVGPSGSGKTTIIDLLTHLHVPLTGGIFIDDINLNSVDINIWRNSIGYVGQENFLLNDTLRNNLFIGFKYSEDKSDTKIWKILKLVVADKFVRNLDKGLDTLVGERGLKLSGGQRQRIFIARALMRDPKLLILDEATTGLDEIIEKKVCINLKKLLSDITVIAVTHQKVFSKYADNQIKIK